MRLGQVRGWDSPFMNFTCLEQLADLRPYPDAMDPRDLPPTDSQLRGPRCRPQERRAAVQPETPTVDTHCHTGSFWPLCTAGYRLSAFFSFPSCLDSTHSLPSSPVSPYSIPGAVGMEPRHCERSGNTEMPERSWHPGMFPPFLWKESTCSIY